MKVSLVFDWRYPDDEITRQIRQWLKNTILNFILTILIVLSLPSFVYAAETNPQFEHITADQGLSQSGLNSIFQDSQGFMWFGTQDGLNKYDGYDFTVYKYNALDCHSLSDNFITSIYEDKSGIIWIGTDGGGLNKFNRETERFTRYMHDVDNPNSLDQNRVLSIYQDRFGTLWVGTDGGGLNKFDRETEQFTRYQHNFDDPNSLSNDIIFSIYEDNLGTLWIGTGGGGLNKFNHKTGRFVHYRNNLSDPSSLSDDTVLSIHEDQSARLWIGTKNGGLNKFDRESGRFIHYIHDPDNPNSLNHNSVNSIAEDRLGNLWLATTSWYGNSYGSGLDNFIPENGKFIHYKHDSKNPQTLRDNLVNTLWVGNDQILWIGTVFSGIDKLDLKEQKFIHYKHAISNLNSLSDNHVMSIDEGQSGMIWIATSDGGLNQFNRQTEKFTHYTHNSANPHSLSSNNIWSTYEDRNGMLWVGTFGSGLDKFDRKTKKVTHYQHNPNHPYSLSDNTVTSIYEDHLGTLWVGTLRGGLNKFDPEPEKFIHYTNEPNNPNSLSDISAFLIHEDHSGTLWIGTLNGGLNKFQRETENFIHYKHDSNNPNSLSYDRIVSIYEYPSGTLWIGTFGGGLDKFDIATETFTHYTEKDGLPNNSVVGILADDEGNLWLSTGKGLSKFNPKTETFRNYDVSDGLQGNEFDGVKAYLKSKTGEMFFGGLNGFNAFYPDQVKYNPHIPPIVITDFKKFNESVKLDKSISEIESIKLSYKDSFFGFEFAALDYTNPLKNQYAYKLEGFDKDWIYSGTRRYASYTNLDGGTYIFKVKGSNNDGVWNEEGNSIKILISPPPWKTWWAYTLYTVALVSAVIRYVQWKTRAQKKENALLRESERKLNQFLEAIPVGIGVIDKADKFIYTNQIGLELQGIEALLKVPIQPFPETYKAYIAGTEQLYPTEQLPFVRALRGEKITLDDLEIHQPDKIVPLEVWATPIYDEQGAILYALIAFQDITSRKQAEAERQDYIEALQQAKAQLQAVIDTVPGCVAWMTSDGRYLGVNRHLANMFNLSPDAFIGREIGFFLTESHLCELIHQFLASPEPTTTEIIKLSIQNSTRNYLMSVQKYQQNTAAVSVAIDITERMLAEQALRASLREKEILLQEVHHRVKNNLQIICSLLDLQAQNLNDEKTLEVFQESYNRIKSMAIIHEKLYQSTSLEKINFAEYIETLTNHLILSYKVNPELIKTDINIETIYLNIDTAIPCGLIVNELLSNSIKYAFPNQAKGLIELKFKSHKNQKFTLIVKDNGVGFPQDLNFPKKATLGLKLVTVLTQQLEGEIELNQEQGMEFKISFPSVKA
ncbi:PAS domain-containing protein [Microcoleus sp. ZQ-A2]|nr:PAS domain-containing protein [Microcoleus sp. FACHB-1]